MFFGIINILLKYIFIFSKYLARINLPGDILLYTNIYLNKYTSTLVYNWQNYEFPEAKINKNVDDDLIRVKKKNRKMMIKIR